MLSALVNYINGTLRDVYKFPETYKMLPTSNERRLNLNAKFSNDKLMQSFINEGGLLKKLSDLTFRNKLEEALLKGLSLNNKNLKKLEILPYIDDGAIVINFDYIDDGAIATKLDNIKNKSTQKGDLYTFVINSFHEDNLNRSMRNDNDDLLILLGVRTEDKGLDVSNKEINRFRNVQSNIINNLSDEDLDFYTKLMLKIKDRSIDNMDLEYMINITSEGFIFYINKKSNKVTTIIFNER